MWCAGVPWGSHRTHHSSTMPGERETLPIPAHSLDASLHHHPPPPPPPPPPAQCRRRSSLALPGPPSPFPLPLPPSPSPLRTHSQLMWSWRGSEAPSAMPALTPMDPGTLGRWRGTHGRSQGCPTAPSTRPWWTPWTSRHTHDRCSETTPHTHTVHALPRLLPSGFGALPGVPPLLPLPPPAGTHRLLRTPRQPPF